MKKFIVAEDHSLIAIGIIELIKNQYPDAQVSVVNTFGALIDTIKKTNFDTLILNTSLLGDHNFEMIYTIKNANQQLPILIVANQENSSYAIPYLRAGAEGYLDKGACPEEFKVAIKNMIETGRYISEQTTNLTIDLLLNNSEAKYDIYSILKSKEIEVAKLLIKGFSNKQISERMQLSAPSISNYKAKIFSKLGINNIIDLHAYFNNHS